MKMKQLASYLALCVTKKGITKHSFDCQLEETYLNLNKSSIHPCKKFYYLEAKTGNVRSAKNPDYGSFDAPEMICAQWIKYIDKNKRFSVVMEYFVLKKVLTTLLIMTISPGKQQRFLLIHFLMPTNNESTEGTIKRWFHSFLFYHYAALSNFQT